MCVVIYIYIYIYIYARREDGDDCERRLLSSVLSLSNSLRCRDTRTPINMKKALKQNKVEE
jgi:hypothetical protein